MRRLSIISSRPTAIVKQQSLSSAGTTAFPKTNIPLPRYLSAFYSFLERTPLCIIWNSSPTCSTRLSEYANSMSRSELIISANKGKDTLTLGTLFYPEPV